MNVGVEITKTIAREEGSLDARIGSDIAASAVHCYARRLLRGGLATLLLAATAVGVAMLVPGVVPDAVAAVLPGGAGVLFGVGLLAAAAAQHRRQHAAGSRPIATRALAALSLLLCLLCAGVCRLAVWTIVEGQSPAMPLPTAAAWFAALAVGTFALLVGERALATTPAHELPEAAGLTRLARLLLLALAATGIDVVGRTTQAGWAAPVVAAAAVCVALAAAEAVIRSLATLLLPLAAAEKPSLLAGNGVASLLTRRPWMLPAAGRDALKSRFGVDLSRSWALGFARRAALPIAAVLAGFAWCLTSVHLVPTAGRAVAERFGVPVAVLQPGLHLTMPWPFGRLRPVELGTVHRIPIGYGAGETSVVQNAAFEAPTEDAEYIPLSMAEPPPEEDRPWDARHANAAFEAPPPAEDEPAREEDRLWDARHASEATFLIASAPGHRQSFAVLQVDVSVLYRIGLDDASALRATYGVDGPETMVRDVAGKLIVRYFASVSLLDALGGDRVRIERDLLAAIRDALDDLASGIDAVAVVVEALHPPPQAAAAYHRVQAAEITAAVKVATARARAVTTLEAARSSALTERATAVATAADTVAAARIDALLFQADDAGWRAGPDAFTFERYLARLEKGLAGARLLLVDFRLGGAAAPLLDLRGATTALSGEGWERPAEPPAPDAAN